MKRLFALLLSLSMIFSIGVCSAFAETDLSENENCVLLSSLNDEECRDFLLSQGVTIPEEFSDMDLPKLFADFENDPDMVISLGWIDLANFIEEIRSAVKSYYGINTAPSAGTTLSAKTAQSARALAYTLQYSTLYSWNPATMRYYNCYAYALGRTSGCQPGDFSNQSYNDSASIASLAEVVKDDLNGDLGYDCVKVQSNRPASTSGWANVIAVRKDTTRDAGGKNDYHFAKLSSSNWYHKPGGTAILKFNSAPSNSVVWTNETYDGSYNEPTVTYDSSIRYLLYKSSHGNTTYTWTGEHYHSGTTHCYLYAYVCDDCGDYVSTVLIKKACSGPPCNTPWSLTPTPEVA